MIDFWWFAFYAGVNALVVTLLAFYVSYNRITLRVANGDGGNIDMKKSIRAHMNGVEHVSIFGLVVLGLAVMQVSSFMQGLIVIVFTLGRVLHGFSMLAVSFQIRRLSAALTYVAELLGVVVLLLSL